MAETRNPAGPEGRPETLLDEAFAAARAARVQPVPEALFARVLADAERLRPASAPAVAPRPGPLAGLFAALGGWPALGGLATAGVAGFWLGIAPPAAVRDIGLWSATDAGVDLFLPDDYLAENAEG